ncbi:MAG: alpha-N-acetylglucosaminidase [Porphyromonas sp.]|nr:alpha-N-acetylglucosaminidase [Porphyromonas sp.]
MRIIIIIITLYPLLLFAEGTRSARQVIERFAETRELPLRLDLGLESVEGCDVFETEVSGDSLIVRGSSPIALCRGFYDYIRRHGYGLSSWSGNRLNLPSKLTAEPRQRTSSPFVHRYYLNVVTYGYTMPYWDWERWEREIDWMALHGINMPLALVAQEAISARVWRRLGLSEAEIADYFVGPAHLPWMRMGNISGIDGPLSERWHQGQIALQHRILDRMRSLGMTPICPAFSGFVPKALSRVYPQVKIVETSWGGAFRNWMLMPDEELFLRIGQMFIQEWEREFGGGRYYLADSFNEMEIPFPPHGDPVRYEQLARYGERLYQSIRSGNEQAVWVMQGWMFGYQRDIWDQKTLQALLSRVPDEGMLLLDLAVDYNVHFWRNTVNWEYYQGFYGKPWIYSLIPNMGGKTAMTGVLDFYANGHLEALRSPHKGRLRGYGMAPEGLENNELIYELLSEAAWRDTKLDLETWLEGYCRSRYGVYTPALGQFWALLRRSVYGSFTDHPRYRWQFRPGLKSKGTVCSNEDFCQAVELLADSADILRSSPLFAHDLADWAVAYLGAKAERLVERIERAYTEGRLRTAEQDEALFVELMHRMDALLTKHPTHRLEPWLDYARGRGTTSQERQAYERNARRIISIWGPPVDDYSARLWSGLIRDYYLPRWQHYFASRRSGQPFDFAAWERQWVEQTPALSPIHGVEDIVAYARESLARCRGI